MILRDGSEVLDSRFGVQAEALTQCLKIAQDEERKRDLK